MLYFTPLNLFVNQTKSNSCGTIGLARYFGFLPKKTDFAIINSHRMKNIENLLNNRPPASKVFELSDLIKKPLNPYLLHRLIECNFYKMHSFLEDKSG